MKRSREQGPSVSKNPLPEHKGIVGMIAANEEFDDPAQLIIEEVEAMGVIEGNPARMKRMLSAEEFVARHMDGIMKGQFPPPKEKAEEPFVVETEGLDDEPFVLELPFFELELGEPVLLEYPKQLPVHSL